MRSLCNLHALSQCLALRFSTLTLLALDAGAMSKKRMGTRSLFIARTAGFMGYPWVLSLPHLLKC